MGEAFEIGDKVPDFKLPGNDNTEYTLQSFSGKKLVLYFYPKDNTSACTNQALAFNANLGAIAKAGAVVVGVSRDAVKSHQKFVEKFGFAFVLLADTEATVCKAYDVLKEKMMFGKQVFGIERSTFVIDAEGKLLKAFRRVKVDGHVEEVLKILQA